jgi:hypothetical protein
MVERLERPGLRFLRVVVMPVGDAQAVPTTERLTEWCKAKRAKSMKLQGSSTAVNESPV